MSNEALRCEGIPYHHLCSHHGTPLCISATDITDADDAHALAANCTVGEVDVVTELSAALSRFANLRLVVPGFVTLHHGCIGEGYAAKRANGQAEGIFCDRLTPLNVTARMEEGDATGFGLVDAFPRAGPVVPLHVTLLQRRERLEIFALRRETEKYQALYRARVRDHLGSADLRVFGPVELGATLLLPALVPMVGSEGPLCVVSFVHADDRSHTKASSSFWILSGSSGPSRSSGEVATLAPRSSRLGMRMKRQRLWMRRFQRAAAGMGYCLPSFISTFYEAMTQQTRCRGLPNV